MDILCPRCRVPASPAGHEGARAIHRCEICNRVWMTHLTPPTTGRRPRASTRVLVVDDSDQLVGLIALWLEEDGYAVSTATSGARALVAAAAEPPDVVLLDLVLPPPDGFALCESFQRTTPPPAIVIMTGVSDPLRLRRLDGRCVCAVLHKPLTHDLVLEAVSRARRLRWDARQRRAVS
jgi:DNA-binding response OmpR family regulator